MSNRVPRIRSFNRNVVDDEQIAVSSLVRINDRDGDEIVRYRVRLNSAPKGGYLYLGDRRLAPQRNYWLSAAQWSDLTFRGNLRTNRNELSEIQVRAFDGQGWSQVASSRVRTLINANRPLIRAPQRFEIQNERQAPLSNMFSFFDEDASTPKIFQFQDISAHGGHFLVNGQVRHGRFRVRAEHLDRVVYQAADGRATDDIQIAAYDGRFWSPVKNVRVETLVRPEIAARGGGFPVLDDQEVISLGTSFQKTTVGPAFTEYEIIDMTPGIRSGAMIQGGNRVEAGVVHRFADEEFQSLRFEGGKFEVRSNDQFMIRAYNGQDWTRWTSFEINTEPNIESSLAVTSWQEFNSTRDPMIVTYSFLNFLPAFYDGEQESNEFRGLTNTLRVAAREAMQSFENVLNVQFVETPTDRLGTITFGMADLDDEALAWAYLPAQPEPQIPFTPGDIWYNWYDFPGFWLSPGNKGPGSSAYETTIHEIGHALGLKHPFEGNSRLSSTTDTSQYTVMSYSGHAQNVGLPASTPMLYDIAALQSMYGRNMSYETGNTVWSFATDEAIHDTIWDAGGVDRIDMSNQNVGARIDLRQGQYSSVSRHVGFFGLANSVDNLGIAYGTEIEHANGTNFNDFIGGNELRNSLRGNNGDDVLRGRQHDDWLFGGGGNDTYQWHLGDGDDIIDDLGNGRDTLQLHAHELIRLQDLTFRREGRDLLVDLTLEGPETTEGLLRIQRSTNQSRVETLEFWQNGAMRGRRVDLTSVYTQAGNVGTKFELTNQLGNFGWMAEVV